MFDDKLPFIPIVMSSALTFVGRCAYRRQRTLSGKVRYCDFRLRINNRIDMAEDELDDIIIHEMIHYYIAVNGIADTSSHGHVFRQMMDEINARYGRHITISHRSTPQQRDQAMAGKRPTYKVIAVVSMADGKQGIKVLPRVLETILNYYNTVSGNDKVRDVKLYMSDDKLFDHYPKSGALRVYPLDAETIKTHLAEAEKLKCDGKSIKFDDN